MLMAGSFPQLPHEHIIVTLCFCCLSHAVALTLVPHYHSLWWTKALFCMYYILISVLALFPGPASFAVRKMESLGTRLSLYCILLVELCNLVPVSPVSTCGL